MDTRRMVFIGCVVVWATLMIAELITGARWLLYAAILVIVLQVILTTQMRRR